MTATLNRPTLVLNRSWQAVGVVPVSRALTLLWKGVARVVDVEDYQMFSWEDWSVLRPKDGDDFMQAINCRLRVPEVIALTRYDKLPNKAVTFSRRNVFKRDKYVCQYCGVQPGSEELTLDHVEPRSRGGESCFENVVLACVGCNARKADRRPEECGMKLRKQPVRPTWKPLYANHLVRLDSWSKFVSAAYWDAELEK